MYPRNKNESIIKTRSLEYVKPDMKSKSDENACDDIEDDNRDYDRIESSLFGFDAAHDLDFDRTA